MLFVIIAKQQNSGLMHYMDLIGHATQNKTCLSGSYGCRADLSDASIILKHETSSQEVHVCFPFIWQAFHVCLPAAHSLTAAKRSNLLNVSYFMLLFLASVKWYMLIFSLKYAK